MKTTHHSKILNHGKLVVVHLITANGHFARIMHMPKWLYICLRIAVAHHVDADTRRLN